MGGTDASAGFLGFVISTYHLSLASSEHCHPSRHSSFFISSPRSAADLSLLPVYPFTQAL